MKTTEVMRLLSGAMSYCDQAHNYVFAETEKEDERNMHTALSFIASASAQMYAAKALYFSDESLENGVVEELFHLFETFFKEIQTNYATDHSHQWTDIEFKRLKEAFDDSPCSQPLQN